jgi:HPt (histidine-containing phosphotransfer) domain-containing protein
MTSSSPIDPAAHERLLEWGGPKLLNQMIRLYLENQDTRLDQIRAGFESGSAEEVERGAHSLKSSAGNVGAVEVRRLCAEMEDRATEGDLEGARALQPALESARDAAQDALSARVADDAHEEEEA